MKGFTTWSEDEIKRQAIAAVWSETTMTPKWWYMVSHAALACTVPVPTFTFGAGYHWPWDVVWLQQICDALNEAAAQAAATRTANARRQGQYDIEGIAAHIVPTLQDIISSYRMSAEATEIFKFAKLPHTATWMDDMTRIIGVPAFTYAGDTTRDTMRDTTRDTTREEQRLRWMREVRGVCDVLRKTSARSWDCIVTRIDLSIDDAMRTRYMMEAMKPEVVVRNSRIRLAEI